MGGGGGGEASAAGRDSMIAQKMTQKEVTGVASCSGWCVGLYDICVAHTRIWGSGMGCVSECVERGVDRRHGMSVCVPVTLDQSLLTFMSAW